MISRLSLHVSNTFPVASITTYCVTLFYAQVTAEQRMWLNLQEDCFLLSDGSLVPTYAHCNDAAVPDRWLPNNLHNYRWTRSWWNFKKKIHMSFGKVQMTSHHSSPIILQDFSEYLPLPCDTTLLLLLRKHKTASVSAELLCYRKEHRWRKYQVFACLPSLWSNGLRPLTSHFLPILFPALPQICPSTSVAAAIPPWPSFLSERLRYINKNFPDRAQLSGPQPPASQRTNQSQTLGLAALNER